MSALRGLARNAGCTHLSVTTTNDSVDALRFYQRRGFHLVRLRAGAVDESRVSLKPEIPEVGDHGIALCGTSSNWGRPVRAGPTRRP